MKQINYLYERIENAKKRCGQTKNVEILAVTKNRSAQEIMPLLTQGILCIGENRVQEAENKFSCLEIGTVQKHFIGTLQSNKENKVLELFDVIQSIESCFQLERLIEKINRRRVFKKIFIQVNISLEASKHGIQTEKELYRMIDTILANGSYVLLEGLMMIGMLTDDESTVRQSFSQMFEFRNKVLSIYPEIKELKLSMGMSNDFEWAIQEGSDMVRLGRILFDN